MLRADFDNITSERSDVFLIEPIGNMIMHFRCHCCS